MQVGTDTTVHARVSYADKQRAMQVLDQIGLSISDLIRITLRRVAEEQAIPFELYVPNRETLQAIAEIDQGKGKKFKTVDELFKEAGV